MACFKWWRRPTFIEALKARLPDDAFVRQLTNESVYNVDPYTIYPRFVYDSTSDMVRDLIIKYQPIRVLPNKLLLLLSDYCAAHADIAPSVIERYCMKLHPDDACELTKAPHIRRLIILNRNRFDKYQCVLRATVERCAGDLHDLQLLLAIFGKFNSQGIFDYSSFVFGSDLPFVSLTYLLCGLRDVHVPEIVQMICGFDSVRISRNLRSSRILRDKIALAICFINMHEITVGIAHCVYKSYIDMVALATPGWYAQSPQIREILVMLRGILPNEIVDIICYWWFHP